jgi:hypothetical protein
MIFCFLLPLTFYFSLKNVWESILAERLLIFSFFSFSEKFIKFLDDDTTIKGHSTCVHFLNKVDVGRHDFFINKFLIKHSDGTILLLIKF